MKQVIVDYIPFEVSPEQINESFIFNYEDNFNAEWLEQQPDWIQDQIKGTDEYKSKIKTDDIPF